MNRVEYTPRRTGGAGEYRRQSGTGNRSVEMCRKGDETARREYTVDTTAYTMNMLSKERTMDCIMQSRLRDETICLEARHNLKTR